MIRRVRCPRCGGFASVRERGRFDVLWSVVGAGTWLMRLLVSRAGSGQDPAQPGVYRCMACGHTFVALF